MNINKLNYLIALTAFCLFSSNALSQSISLSGPANVTVADADEFFNDVWGDPKVFDDNCDIGYDGYYFEPEVIAGGIWTGAHPLVTGPILGIMPIPVVGTQLAYRENCGRLGVHYPLDAGKYTRMSFRNLHNTPSDYQILWSKENNYAVTGFFMPDGYFLPSGHKATTPANTWSIKSLDLPALAPANHTWSGNVMGLSIFSSLGQPAGQAMSYDWVRVIDPSTSPTIDLSWTSSGTATNDHVVLFVDDNNSDFNGDPIEYDLPKSGNLDFLTGVLPPGTYYFYTELRRNSGSNIQTLSRSNHIGPVTINGKPTIKITSPSRTTGEEYSASERGDAWDMNQSTDVVNLLNADGSQKIPLHRGFHDYSFNGYFQATTDNIPGQVTDTHMQLPLNPSRPINPQKYRYFCYDMQVDNVHLPRDGDNLKLNEAGWVARLVWMDLGTFQLGSTKAHELVERSHTYPDLQNGLTEFCIDLWDPESYESGIDWRDFDSIEFLRFDPLEATPATRFTIGHAALYAENRPDVNNNFEIKWEAFDPNNDIRSIEIFIDSNRQGFNGQRVATLNSSEANSGSYTLNTASINQGKYFIYFKVEDSRNTQYVYSDTILDIGNLSFPPIPDSAPCDFDGDGKTDVSVARGTGAFLPSYWFIRRSADAQVEVYPWGTDNLDVYLGADLNGDRVSDKVLFRGKADPFTTFITDLSGGLGQLSQGWGLFGDVPIVADLDGDDIDDMTVFRPTTGTLWSIQSTDGAVGHSWGMWGDIPVAADFDGDNKDDLAVWRPSDGFWWILQSTKNNSTAPNDIMHRQFGLPGDSPMPGDYTGDGISDLVVYRPTTGHWFTCESETGFDCFSNLQVTQFGLPGDIPIKADFDGDGTLDRAIYRPNGGLWFYIESSTGQIGVLQHGGFPTDWPLCGGTRNVMQNLGIPIP